MLQHVQNSHKSRIVAKWLPQVCWQGSKQQDSNPKRIEKRDDGVRERACSTSRKNCLLACDRWVGCSSAATKLRSVLQRGLWAVHTALWHCRRADVSLLRPCAGPPGQQVSLP